MAAVDLPRAGAGDVVTALKSDPGFSNTPFLLLTDLVEESPNNPSKLQMKGGLPFVSKTSDLEVTINGIISQLAHH